MTAGRPSTYTDEIADIVCEAIATSAEGLERICEQDGRLPPWRTIYGWLAKNPEFEQRYLRARETQAHILMDECVAIADDTSKDTIVGERGEYADSEWIARSKLRVDTRMRMAGKLNPKRYGDATLHKHADADGNKISGPMMIFDVEPQPSGDE